MRKLLLPLFCLLFIISCSNDDINNINQNQLSLEAVVGNITSPSGQVIPNVLVFYDDEGTIYSTKTDQNGNFELEVPTGQGILQIQTGNGKLFNSSFEIDVIPGTILDLTSQNLRLESNSNLAFLAGSYDSIENIITDLGYTIDEVTIADIENGLSGYDAVFLNCTGNLSSFSDAF